MKNKIIHAGMEIDNTVFIFNDYMEEMTMGDNFFIIKAVILLIVNITVFLCFLISKLYINESNKIYGLVI